MKPEISRTLTNSSSSLFQLDLLSTSSSVYHSSPCFSVMDIVTDSKYRFRVTTKKLELGLFRFKLK